MRLEHHLVGGYVRYISPHIIIILLLGPALAVQLLSTLLMMVINYDVH